MSEARTCHPDCARTVFAHVECRDVDGEHLAWPPDDPICPICKHPYGRLPEDGRHVGEGNCLSRVLDFLSLEFPAFTLVGRLDNGKPFVLTDHMAEDEALQILETYLTQPTTEPGSAPDH